MLNGIQSLTSPAFQTKLAQCIHCGMCLQACPTYNVFGTEMDSPRGRLALMRAASEDRIEPEYFNSSFSQHINLCLSCRACETACPSGVEYSFLVEQTRFVVEQNRPTGVLERLTRWAGTKQFLPHLPRLKFLARVLHFYQICGLQKIVRSIDILPEPLRTMEGILPPLTGNFNVYDQKYLPLGDRLHKVLFFTGCVQEGFLPQVNRATIRVLQINGCEVRAPGTQTCCGAAQLHLGDVEFARELARRNIDAFLEYGTDFDAIINNAGGCGISLKEYPHLLADDQEYAQKALDFASKVMDVNEFLFDHLSLAPHGELDLRAVYSDSCHLRHGQKVILQPRLLLKRIPGLELIELSSPDQCCGSAGVYNIMHTDTANRILDAKMMDIVQTEAQLIVTSNTGCYMQLVAGARRTGSDCKVMHVVEVLDWSYSKQGIT